MEILESILPWWKFSTGFCLGGILAKDQRFHLGSYRLSVHWGRWRFSLRGVDTLKRYAGGRAIACWDTERLPLGCWYTEAVRRTPRHGVLIRWRDTLEGSPQGAGTLEAVLQRVDTLKDCLRGIGTLEQCAPEDYQSPSVSAAGAPLFSYGFAGSPGRGSLLQALTAPNAPRGPGKKSFGSKCHTRTALPKLLWWREGILHHLPYKIICRKRFSDKFTL